MYLFADIATKTLVTSATNKTSIGGLNAFAGNIVPVSLQFVDTSVGAVVNLDSWTLSVALGDFQAPLIPVITQVTNESETPTVWQFYIDLKLRAVRDAIAGLTAVNKRLQVFITNSRYKATIAMNPVAINATVIPFAVSSSTSSISSLSLSSHSSASSFSSSSRSSSSVHEFHASGFGDAGYNGALRNTGQTLNGQPIYITSGGPYPYAGVYWYYDPVEEQWDASPSIGATVGDAIYVACGGNLITSQWCVDNGDGPAGTVT